MLFQNLNHTRRPERKRSLTAFLGLSLYLFVCNSGLTPSNAQELTTPSSPDEYECFIEPYRSVDVPAAEMGVLAEVLVQEGDVVFEKQVLARLDDEVLRRSLDVARATKDATGSLLAAISEQESKTRQFESVKTLHQGFNATEREMQRASTAVALANARVQIARDELEVRRLEFERTKSQLRKRQIESPLSGTVVSVAKEAGEYISPTDPVVLTIVDLSRLKAIFSIPHAVASAVKTGEEVSLLIDGVNAPIVGKVEFVSPTTDPQSGTVRVKVRIENQDKTLPCGANCRWKGDAQPPTRHVSQTPKRIRREW